MHEMTSEAAATLPRRSLRGGAASVLAAWGSVGALWSARGGEDEVGAGGA